MHLPQGVFIVFVLWHRYGFKRFKGFKWFKMFKGFKWFKRFKMFKRFKGFNFVQSVLLRARMNDYHAGSPFTAQLDFYISIHFF